MVALEKVDRRILRLARHARSDNIRSFSMEIIVSARRHC